jgi:hypothetical protein
MTLNTYAHVIDELRGAPRLPAAQEIVRARQAVAERGPDRVGEDERGSWASWGLAVFGRRTAGSRPTRNSTRECSVAWNAQVGASGRA